LSVKYALEEGSHRIHRNSSWCI